MNEIRLKRLNNTYLEEISRIILEEVHDPDIKMVTITACQVTNDLSYCKVYFTCLDRDKTKEITKSLNGAASFIRTLLAERVEVRNTPELKFIYDDSIEYGNRIDEIINDIHEKENKQ